MGSMLGSHVLMEFALASFLGTNNALLSASFVLGMEHAQPSKACPSEGHAQTWKSNQVLIGLYCLLQKSL